MPHVGLAPAAWMDKFRTATLHSNFTNITHNGKRVDCNPASCDNPKICGIPPCRGTQAYSCGPGGVLCKTYTKGIKRCGPGGCGLERNFKETLGRLPGVHANVEPTTFWMQLPSTRFGYFQPGYYTAGFMAYSPVVVEFNRYGDIGTWLQPGAGNCNPLKLMVSSKASMAHTGISPQDDGSEKKSVAFFIKRTWCISEVCERKTCPLRCYVHKEGRCILFKKNVMPMYASQSAPSHSQAAWKLFAKGEVHRGVQCSKAATRGAEATIAAN